MSTTSHQTVSQHQGHSLDGRGRISSQLTKAGHRRTDRKNKPCEPLGVTRIGKNKPCEPLGVTRIGKNTPPSFFQSSSPFFLFILPQSSCDYRQSHTSQRKNTIFIDFRQLPNSLLRDGGARSQAHELHQLHLAMSIPHPARYRARRTPSGNMHLLLEGGLHHLGLSLPCLQCLKPRAEMPFTRAEMQFHPLDVSFLLCLLDMRFVHMVELLLGGRH